jgi:hypothetical protein
VLPTADACRWLLLLLSAGTASTVAVYSAEIRARTSLSLRSFSILVIRAKTLAWVSGSSSPGAAFRYVTTSLIYSRLKARPWSGGRCMPRRL